MPKPKKGMMSLEVIIAFIILLVVAAIIISMMFTQINPKQLDRHTIELNQMQFKNKCEALCFNTDSIDYCRYYFKGGKETILDWDGNGMRNEIISVGETITWDVCEDRIYCFLAVPCKRFGLNPIKGCVSALCTSYLTKYEGNVTRTDEAVLDKIKSGSCKLEETVTGMDNWYLQYYPPDVCGCECAVWVDQSIGASGVNITCGPSQMYQNRTCKPDGCREESERCKDVSPTLSGCIYNPATSMINCKTNCVNRVDYWTNITVTDALVVSAITSWNNGPVTGGIIFAPGNITFTTVPLLSTLDQVKASWNVELICSKPQGIATITGVN